MKHALLAASLVLIGGGAVACGDGGGEGGSETGGAPTAASKTEFCDAFNSLFTDVGQLAGADGEAPAEEELLEQFKKWADTMEDVGTPEGIPDDARAGFEVAMQQVEDLQPEDLEGEGLAALEDKLSEDEKAQGQAFTTYTNETCGDPLEELVPSDAPS